MVPKRKYILNAMKLDTQSRWSLLIINMIWYSAFRSGCSPAFYRIAILKNFLGVRRMWWSHFLKLKPLRVSRRWCSVKNFKSPKQVMESFFGVKYFKTVMLSFFSIKNFKSRKKVTESFFSIKSFKSRKGVVEFFFSFKSCKSCKTESFSVFTLH